MNKTSLYKHNHRPFSSSHQTRAVNEQCSSLLRNSRQGCLERKMSSFGSILGHSWHCHCAETHLICCSDSKHPWRCCASRQRCESMLTAIYGGVGAGANRWVTNVFTACVGRECAAFVTGFICLQSKAAAHWLISRVCQEKVLLDWPTGKFWPWTGRQAYGRFRQQTIKRCFCCAKRAAFHARIKHLLGSIV